MANDNYQLEILLPVHDEGQSIKETLREIHAEISGSVPFRFIICEDGSRDNTKEVLSQLVENLPMKLSMSNDRKGYARAVRDGMHQLDAPYLLCLDSDGQCNPGNFWEFWNLREEYDVVVGWRVRRADNLFRRILSRTFFFFYQILFHVPLHDPSCPFILIKRGVVEALRSELGDIEGFWWEFNARAQKHGYSLAEVPVKHRFRAAGNTKVYRLTRLPGIAFRNIVALLKIRITTQP
jgi:glycosyltransferase involved in cell wall biosynthesis